ncbi:MAG: GerMN domain-containing protein [Actinobacteria bacterium]|nr:GerMN domain-containing protein [Actinomycetota bacterium]
MKTTIKVLLIMALVALFAIIIIGCEEGDKSSTSVTDAQEYSKAARDAESPDTAGEDKAAKTSKAQTIAVTLYFSDDQAEHLVPEIHQIKKTSTVAKAAMEELIKGPAESGHHATIPPETKVLGVEINQNIAYVNFSQELIDQHWGGSAGERMTIASIVDTLTEFKSIQKVQILVEGKVVETIAGHSDVSKPLARDEKIIKK